MGFWRKVGEVRLSRSKKVVVVFVNENMSKKRVCLSLGRRGVRRLSFLNGEFLVFC